MNINTSVQCVEMVKILKTNLQTSNIKRFEKCKTKAINNPREKELFTSSHTCIQNSVLEQSCQIPLRQEARSNSLQTSSFVSVL